MSVELLNQSMSFNLDYLGGTCCISHGFCALSLSAVRLVWCDSFDSQQVACPPPIEMQTWILPVKIELARYLPTNLGVFIFSKRHT